MGTTLDWRHSFSILTLSCPNLKRTSKENQIQIDAHLTVTAAQTEKKINDPTSKVCTIDFKKYTQLKYQNQSNK